MILKGNFMWRNGDKHIFMSSFSNAMEKMKLDSGLSQKDCEILLHVSSFVYFNKLAIKKTSFLKSLDISIVRLKEANLIRTIVKHSEKEQRQEYLCITPKGDALCDVFYRNLLSQSNHVHSTTRE